MHDAVTFKRSWLPIPWALHMVTGCIGSFPLITLIESLNEGSQDGGDAKGEWLMLQKKREVRNHCASLILLWWLYCLWLREHLRVMNPSDPLLCALSLAVSLFLPSLSMISLRVQRRMSRRWQFGSYRSVTAYTFITSNLQTKLSSCLYRSLLDLNMSHWTWHSRLNVCIGRTSKYYCY